MYEGGDSLTFELCEARRVLSSVVLARGQVSVAEVFRAGGARRAWSIALATPDSRIVATLTTTFCCRSTTFGNVGGIGALKTPASHLLSCEALRFQFRESFDAFEAMSGVRVRRASH